MPVPPFLSSDGLGWRSLAAYRFKYPSSYQLELPPSGGHTISVHLNNSCQVQACWNGRIRRNRSVPGDINIVGAQQSNSWNWRGGAIDKLEMFLDPALVNSTSLEAYGRPTHLIEGICFRDAFVSAMATRVMEEMTRPGGSTNAFVEVMAQTLAWHLVRGHSSLRKPVETTRVDMSPHKVRIAMDYMMSHLCENTSIHSVASAVNMSTFRFMRGFKKATGESPYQFLIKKRIELAQDLLRSTDQPIVEVVATTGFSTQSHMTATFRRHCNMTPAEYRRTFK